MTLSPTEILNFEEREMPMLPPSSSSSKSPPSESPFNRYLQHQSPKFPPIRESEELDDGDESIVTATPLHHHQTTPFNNSTKSTTSSKMKPKKNNTTGDEEGGVSCMKCRPKPRERISVVPLDTSGSNKQTSLTSTMASPNIMFKSICSSLGKKSPKAGSAVTESPTADVREEQWRIALTELSQKLIYTTRKRDEAVLESSKLKHDMSELEKKLNKLEIYCHSLKSNLDLCNTTAAAAAATNNNSNKIDPNRRVLETQIELIHQDKVVESFLQSISESRSNVRALSKALTIQLRQTGAGKINDKISTLLQPYDIKLSSISKSPRTFLYYLEALLNRTFFEDFESVGFEKNSPNHILNPLDRSESNYASYMALRDLTWEEVLNKGTKHYSESFSRFCDRKMNEVAAMLGWNRAWPEPLLQAFFYASKCVWLVHLLANSVHPSLPVFRIEPDSRFDSVYMADLGSDRVKKLVPTVVRVMVAPGFYVFGNVVKCKVLCRYVAEPNHDVNLNRSD